MSKLIALKSLTSDFDEILSDAFESNFSIIKQQTLLFDQIGIFELSNFYEIIEKALRLSTHKKPNLDLANEVRIVIAEMEWLQQKGIIFELKIEEELSNPQFIRSRIGQQYENAKNLINRAWEIETIDLKRIKGKTRKNDLLKEQRHALFRFMALAMEATKGVTVVTTSPYKEYTRHLPSSSKTDVAQIVINKLPLPNNETSWEQIIDYRNDPENQKNLLTLRRWIRKISSENLSPAEIEDEIEWLTNEFQEHMKYHKIKANTETLEVLVKAPLEIIEDIVKLKWSKIPEPFFALKKRQLMLMEAETNAPGKELAYIIKSNEAF